MKKTHIAGAALAAMLSGSMALAQPAPGQKRGPDANQDGVVTQEEARAQAAKMFERIDFIKDGKVDKADRDARMAERFKKMDTDGSGELSLDEVQHALRHGAFERSRSLPLTAPAHGLVLQRVAFAPEDDPFTGAGVVGERDEEDEWAVSV